MFYFREISNINSLNNFKQKILVTLESVAVVSFWYEREQPYLLLRKDSGNDL